MELVAERVVRTFDACEAVTEVNTCIAPGITAILGANGAGKSTFMRLLAGWIPTSSGRITLGGERLTPAKEKLRRSLMLLDEPRAGEAKILSAIGQVVDAYQIDRPGIEGEVADWVERFQLLGTYHKSTRSVSKCQHYKSELICLFIVNPMIWMLDEPFSCGLDASGLQILEDQMLAHRASGGTIIFSTQWPKHAQRLADQILVFDEGRLALDKKAKEPIDSQLMAEASTSLVAVLSGLAAHE